MGVLNVLERVFGVVRYRGRGIISCEVSGWLSGSCTKKGSLYPLINRTESITNSAASLI